MAVLSLEPTLEKSWRREEWNSFDFLNLWDVIPFLANLDESKKELALEASS